MIELLKPFTSARAFAVALFSWGLPLALALGVYAIFVYPAIEQTALARAGARAFHHGSIHTWGFIAGLLIILTVGLSSTSRWIYQVLEGIRWPGWLRSRRERTHSLQWAVLASEASLEEAESRLAYADQQLALEQERLESATDDQGRAAVEATITTWRAEMNTAQQQVKEAKEALGKARADRHDRPLGELRRNQPPLFVLNSINAYPAQPEWIRATRLGNRIRAFETDAVDRYGLDPLALWYELLVTAPSDLADNIQAARQGVELWVGTWSAALLLGLASLASELIAALARSAHAPITPLVVIALSWIAATTAYRFATAATDEWSFAISALVNLGRGPLARAYGLQIPASVADEKLMWEALRGYILYGTEPYARRLDEYRTQPTQAPIRPPQEETSAAAGA